jgi:hypothetical protein
MDVFRDNGCFIGNGCFCDNGCYLHITNGCFWDNGCFLGQWMLVLICHNPTFYVLTNLPRHPVVKIIIGVVWVSLRDSGCFLQ